MLASASEVLCHQLVPSAKSAPPFSIHVDNISGQTWTLVLEFIYTGDVIVKNVAEAQDLINAGDELHIPLVRLVLDCSSFFPCGMGRGRS